MKKQTPVVQKSKLSDLRKTHGVVVLTNLKVIQGGALLQTPPDGSGGVKP
jgi:hypothetical protein